MTDCTTGLKAGVSPSKLALLASCGVVLYVLIDVLLAFLRPGVSLLHQAESDYGVGPYSWLMDINFLLRGALSLTLCGALLSVRPRRTAQQVGVGFLAAWGVGSAILAFFPDDPLGTPVTTSGEVHLAVALLAFLCAVVATIVLPVDSRRVDALRSSFPVLLAVAVLAALALALLGHHSYGRQALGGLWERIFLALELLWILIVGLQLHRASSSEMRSDRP